jgi:hypothetical protein
LTFYSGLLKQFDHSKIIKITWDLVITHIPNTSRVTDLLFCDSPNCVLTTTTTKIIHNIYFWTQWVVGGSGSSLCNLTEGGLDRDHPLFKWTREYFGWHAIVSYECQIFI